ncbi:MAG: hypothetical protein AAFQ81_07070 [Pseudomonadota bacterium]
METTLYDILIEQGIDKTRAKHAVKAFVTRDEARHVLATKDDLRKLTVWIAGMLIGQLVLFTGLLALMLN